MIEWDYPELEIVVNDEVIVREPGLLATAGNGTCSGGGFYLTPRADPSDGLLDLCVVTRPSVMGVVRLLPALLRGRHLGHPAVSYRQVPGVRVRSPEGLCVHVDGEMVSNNATDISIEVIPAALTIVAPRLG